MQVKHFSPENSPDKEKENYISINDCLDWKNFFFQVYSTEVTEATFYIHVLKLTPFEKCWQNIHGEYRYPS